MRVCVREREIGLCFRRWVGCLPRYVCLSLARARVCVFACKREGVVLAARHYVGCLPRYEFLCEHASAHVRVPVCVSV